MIKPRWPHIKSYHEFKSLILLIILISSLFSQLAILLVFTSSLQNSDVNCHYENNAFTKVPRLGKNPTLFRDDELRISPTQTFINENNHSMTNLAIGSQMGTGGGSVTIRDTFNWTGTEIMNTTNEYVSGVPSNQPDSITITNSS